MKNNILILITISICCLLFSGCENPNGTITYADNSSASRALVSISENTNSEMTDPVSTETEIYLSIQGCVASPGVYLMPRGTRLFELINEAGGVIFPGDTQTLNLARELTDGEQVIIPAERDEGVDPCALALAGNLDGLTDINTASASELKNLPGIGDTRAKAIIAYREANGPFKTINDIKNVDGIKDGIFEGLKDLICVR